MLLLIFTTCPFFTHSLAPFFIFLCSMPLLNFSSCSRIFFLVPCSFLDFCSAPCSFLLRLAPGWSFLCSLLLYLFYDVLLAPSSGITPRRSSLNGVTWIYWTVTIPDEKWQQYEDCQMGFKYYGTHLMTHMSSQCPSPTLPNDLLSPFIWNCPVSGNPSDKCHAMVMMPWILFAENHWDFSHRQIQLYPYCT